MTGEETKKQRVNLTFWGSRMLIGKHKDTGSDLWAKITKVKDKDGWRQRVSIHTDKECNRPQLPAKCVDLQTMPRQVSVETHKHIGVAVFLAWNYPGGFDLHRDGEMTKGLAALSTRKQTKKRDRAETKGENKEKTPKETKEKTVKETKEKTPKETKEKTAKETKEKTVKSESMSDEEAATIRKEFETSKIAIDDDNYEKIAMACSFLHPKKEKPDRELLGQALQDSRNFKGPIDKQLEFMRWARTGREEGPPQEEAEDVLRGDGGEDRVEQQGNEVEEKGGTTILDGSQTQLLRVL